MGISITQLLIILGIVILLFGAKRLRTLGGDLGESIKGFRKAMKDDEGNEEGKSEQSRVIEGEADRTASQTATPKVDTAQKDKV